MSIVLRFNPKDVTRQKYDEVIRRLEAAGEWPHPPGLEFYVLYGSEGSLRVSLSGGGRRANTEASSWPGRPIGVPKHPFPSWGRLGGRPGFVQLAAQDSAEYLSRTIPLPRLATIPRHHRHRI